VPPQTILQTRRNLPKTANRIPRIKKTETTTFMASSLLYPVANVFAKATPRKNVETTLIEVNM
jgi:hypothetical protein